ncbi:acyl-CoA Delta(11) desaturase-like [Solenopsis invicta]|uniref:acyl-CoA Delta(11) desaturase-like n=1 Tax=Solenopsis invicta TaxID=13686 RepID=UPI00193CB6DF|nr:acyl-CoA Delta(11) desaturase-like [Solenopsis invicta]
MALKPTQVNKELEEKPKFNRPIVWRNVIVLSLLHLGALGGLYLSFTSAKYMTIFFAIFLYEFSLLGISAGAHRLWSHRSYKAKGKVPDAYYTILVILLCFVLPTVIPVVFWEEKWLNAYLIPGVLRHILLLNIALMINLIGHRYGYKPYDKYINQADNLIFSIFSSGEGWHNYHHVFPGDYRSIELKSMLNLTKMFIEFFEKIGWAHDLKYASDETIRKRMKRTGDGKWVKQYNYN